MRRAPPATSSGGARPLGLAVALLLLPSPAGAVTLTPAQTRRLAAALACPGQLRDDAARIRNTERFVALFARVAPRSRMGDRMAVRDRLLRAKGCAETPDELQHTFPEE